MDVDNPVASPGAAPKMGLEARLEPGVPDDLAGLVALCAEGFELARTDLGGDMGIWIRLLAGPLADMRAAHSLCAALQARDVYCAPIAR